MSLPAAAVFSTVVTKLNPSPSRPGLRMRNEHCQCKPPPPLSLAEYVCMSGGRPFLCSASWSSGPFYRAFLATLGHWWRKRTRHFRSQTSFQRFTEVMAPGGVLNHAQTCPESHFTSSTTCWLQQRHRSLEQTAEYWTDAMTFLVKGTMVVSHHSCCCCCSCLFS